MDSKLHRFVFLFVLGETTNLRNQNIAFDGFFVDVVDALVSHNKCTLLSPPKHIDLLDQVSEDELLSIDQSHQLRILLKLDVVLRLESGV